MKTSKFTESQIIFAIKQSETGVKTDEICRNVNYNVDNNTNVNYSLLTNCFAA